MDTYIYPSWTKYVVNSFSSTAYANVPYRYDIDLACDYGSSKANNSLNWIAVGEGRLKNVTLISTTDTSIEAGRRTFTFSNSQIGTYSVRGVIYYTASSGGSGSNNNSAVYPLIVSFLNPIASNVSNTLNGTNFYRTSTIKYTASAIVAANSSSPTVYAYFNDPLASGSESEKGYYQIASYEAGTINSFNNVETNYVHSGNNPGTFYCCLALRGENENGELTEFLTTGQISYTMQQFVAPTTLRTTTYEKHNIYAGQTKLPVKTVVTFTNKSQYDTLTPTCAVRPIINNIASSVSSAFSWAVGTYNATLTVPACIAGDTMYFRSEVNYKNALNEDTLNTNAGSSYIVKAIPQPTIEEINITTSYNKTKKQITAGVVGNFDSDFVGQYTLYLEDASGTTIYSQATGIVDYDGYTQHIFTYNDSMSTTYKIRMVANFALVDESNIQGVASTTYSNIINIKANQLYIKHDGNNIDGLFVMDNECPKPRLAIKYGNTIKYAPLYTNTPPTDVKKLWVRQGSTDYYTLLNTQFGELYPSDDLYPEGNELSYGDLTQYTHQFLSAYTHEQIRDGDIE